MSTSTQKEQISVNYINLYVDKTQSLRSHISVNDKLPIWDGEILVYKDIPDKKDTLIGKVMVQGKSTGVDEFKSIEEHYVPIMDIRNYMRNAGILYFVVELQEKNWEHKIFYRLLSPSLLKSLYSRYRNKQKSVKIRLRPVPNDSHRFELEIRDFLYDSVKQQSFVENKTLRLSDVIDNDKPSVIVSSFVTKEKGDWAWQVTSQPVFLYKQTPYADIPIEDTEFIATVKNVYFNPVKVNGKQYFDRYYLEISYGYVDVIVDECMRLHTPRKGFEDGFKGTIDLRYKFHKKPDECLHRLQFLEQAISVNKICLGDYEYDLCIPPKEQEIFLSQVKNAIDIITDLVEVWKRLHVSFDLDFQDYDDNAIDELCDIVAYIYRKMPCVLMNDNNGINISFNLFETGGLKFVFLAKRISEKEFITVDPFSLEDYKVGKISDTQIMPFLSSALRNLPGYLFDNIDYDDQLEFYRQCFSRDTSVKPIIEEDIRTMQQLLHRVKQEKKVQRVKAFLKQLHLLIGNDD